jgi:3-hydroxyacyl-[acyl-carrier-protein] dehydratase
MRFQLVDRIVEVESGRRIQALKQVTLGEEYLADHFPTFPVLPGVLMLQALVEAGSWLLRISDDFRFSMIVLREAKNVKYGTFVEPGRRLVLTAEQIEQDGPRTTFKGKGEVDGNIAVAARYVLTRYNLQDRNPDLQATDARLIAHWRAWYGVLKGDLARC